MPRTKLVLMHILLAYSVVTWKKKTKQSWQSSTLMKKLQYISLFRLWSLLWAAPTSANPRWSIVLSDGVKQWLKTSQASHVTAYFTKPNGMANYSPSQIPVDGNT